MKIAILGAQGYLGRHLVKALDKGQDHHLTLIDKVTPTRLPNSPHDIITADITDDNMIEMVADALIQSDVICYKMGLLGVPQISDDIQHLGQFFEQNVNCFFKIMLQCQALDERFFGRVKILVDSSVMCFGGRGQKLHVDEDSKALVPFNFYGLSKYALEAMCQFLKRHHKANIHILRYTRVTSSQARNVISAFVEKAQKNEALVLTGTVDKLFNFVHIDDVTEMIVALITQSHPAGIWHCGGASDVTLQALAKSVLKTTESQSQIVVDSHSEHMKNEVEQLYFSDKKTKDILGLASARNLQHIINELEEKKE